MTNLVEKLDPGYFENMCNGAMFARGGKVLVVREANDSYVYCTDVSEADWDDGVRIPNSYFKGWKVFEYPLLGYRRIGDVTAFIERRQSVQRGLKANNLTYNWSPVSLQIRNRGLVVTSESYMRANKLRHSLFFPTFDSIKSLNSLMDGTLSSLVLSSSVMIEPAVFGEQDKYNIYNNERLIGTVDGGGSISFSKPAHAKLFNKAIKEAA